MTNKFNYITLALTLCMLLTACKDSEVVSVVEPDIPEIEKTPIELTVGGVEGESAAITRGVVTDGTDKILQAFNKATKIFMVMKSEYGEEDYQGSQKDKYTVSRGAVSANDNEIVFDDVNKKYWDDAHARSSKLSIWAYAQQANWNTCTFEIPNSSWDGTNPLAEYVGNSYDTSTRFGWEEHQYKNDGKGDKGSMGAIYPCIMTWHVTHYIDASNSSVANYEQYMQDGNSVQYQDLMFSNNLANNGEGKDKRLTFDFGTRKFPTATDKWPDGSLKTQMIFYHALSKITIHVKKGEGFKDNEFKFPTGKNFKLQGFNTSGTFNIKDGEFQQVSSYDIPKIYQHSPADNGDAYTLEALVVPNIHAFLSSHNSSDENSRFVSVGTNDMMVFTIDNVEYKLSSKLLFNALHVDGDPAKALVENASVQDSGDAAYIPLEAGKHYIFTFTVNKARIDKITATIKDWNTVTGSFTPSNANKNMDVNLYQGSEPLADADVVDIYRAGKNAENAAWTSGYEISDKNTFRKVDSSWKLTTEWFWPDNNTYYHLRAIMPTEHSVTTDATNGDYVNLASGPLDGTEYKDVFWGAPLRQKTAESIDIKWNYDFTEGFDKTNNSLATDKKQIYPAIGATESTICFTLFHMTSQITVKLATTNDDSKVELSKVENETTTYATVELLKHKCKGKLLMGNGSIVPSDVIANVPLTKDESTFTYTYGVVPQDLQDVQLCIKTADDNVYLVDLKDVIADISSSGNAANLTTNCLANPYQETQEGSGKYTIDHWHPGYQYEYNITLTKKKVDNVSVKLVDWTPVKMEEKPIQIK